MSQFRQPSSRDGHTAPSLPVMPSQPLPPYANPQQFQQPPSPHAPQLPRQQQPPNMGNDWAYALRATVIVLLVLFGGGGLFVGLHAVSTLTTTVDSNQPITSNEAALPALQAGWTIVQTFSGNGAQQTSIFTVPNDWKIVYACSGFVTGASGTLFVFVMGASDASLDDQAVNVNCPGNQTTTGQTEEHQGGQIYLHMVAAGNWTVQVQLSAK